MKKLKGSLIIFLSMLLLVITVISCSKDSGDGDGPRIESITPSSGLTGATVVITGKNLSESSVTIGGIAAGVSDNTATSLTTRIPQGATAGSKKVVVSNSEGSAETSFNVTGAGAAPVITSITPAEVAKGQSITIAGTSLDNAVVEIATKVAQITNNTATSITVVIPTNIALGSASVRVTTMLGMVTSSVIIK